MNAAGESTGVAKRDILKVCRAEYERGARYWQPVHEGILEDRLFYEGSHYDEEIEPRERRPQALRFVGQETFNVVRHKSAQVTDSAKIIEAVPEDERSTPDDQEVAVSMIEYETVHCQKAFDEYVDMMAISAIAASIGLVWIDYDPELGAYGQIIFRPGDAAKTMWEPGYHDPHDLRCDWLMEERTLPIATIRGWHGKRGVNSKVLSQLKPEPGIADNRGTASGAAIGREDQAVGENQQSEPVLLRYWWFKNDRTVAKRERGRDRVTLKPQDRYMVCGAPGEPGCGWRGDTQGELGMELPEEMPDGCPDCGGPMMRVDENVPVDELLVYPKGKRLVIEAPNQAVDLPLYDGAWPTMVVNPKIDVRSFPIYVFTDYLPADPTKPTGPSDTWLNWTAQAASDYLMTKGFQSAAQYQRYYVMPETGLNDWQGMRFEFRDDQFNVMFRHPDDMSRFGPNGMQVEAIEGSQFDPSLPAYWGMVQQVLNAKQGIADFGLSSSESKDIPATTVAQLTQQADIPMEHLKRRFYRALSKGHGVLWDYIRACTKKARVRLGSGPDEVVEVRGEELPNFSFIVSDAPEFTGLEKARSEALDKLIAVGPEWQEIYADVNNLPRSVLRKVQKKQQEMAAVGAPDQPPPEPAPEANVPLDGMGLAVPPGGPVDESEALRNSVMQRFGPAMLAG